MKCRICGKETAIKIRSYNLAICEDCFVKRLGKRVGETIRRYAMFREKDRVHIVKGERNAQTLTSILEDMDYECEMVDSVEDVPKGMVLALGNLLEDEVADALWRILNWEMSEEIAPVYQRGDVKVVKPLCLITEEEILHYRNIKGIEREEGEESVLKKKLKEKAFLSAGFWLAFYKSLVREKNKLGFA